MVLAFEKSMAKMVGGIYRTLADVYGILLEISSASSNTVSYATVDKVIGFIYTLLGIFMVFRLLVSLLNYLVDPDKVSDKQVGGSKLLLRIVVSLLLLLSLNSIIFPKLHEWQNVFLDTIADLFKDSSDNSILTNPEDALSYDSIENNNDGILYDNVSAAEDVSDLGYSCDAIYSEKSLKGHYSPDLDDFVNAYKGCKVSQVKQRFREYLNAINKYGIEHLTVLGAWSCKTYHKMNPNVCIEWNIKYSNGDNAPYHNYSECTNSTGCYTFRVISQGGEGNDYIFTGLNNDTLHATDFSCKTPNGQFKCDNFVLEMLGVPISTTDNKSFTCSYIYRDADADLYVHNEENNLYYCDQTKYSFAINNEIKIIFTQTDTVNPMFKNGGGTRKWNITTNVTGLSIPSESIVEVTDAFDSNDAVKGLDSYVCPTSIRGLKCSSTSSGIVCSGSEKIIFDADVWDKDPSHYDQTGLTNYGRGSWNSITGDYKMDMHNNVCQDDTIVKSDVDAAVDAGDTDYPANIKKSKYLDWARSLVVQFITPDTGRCAEGSDCRNLYENEFLLNGEKDEAVGKLVQDNKISFDLFLAIIAGIIFVVFIIILCVEVIIRLFKMLLLEAISPVAVVSYMNPSDKVFGQWVKIYFAAYADLFLKLIGLNAAFLFMGAINFNIQSGLVKVAMVMAAFIFAKTVPNLLSKLFGFEANSGFAEIGKVLKLGALGAVGGGLAVGASLGASIPGIAGAFKLGKGSGLGAIGQTAFSALSSGVAGIAGGLQGKVFSGAQAGINKAKTRNDLYRIGVGFSDQLSASTLGLFGMDYASIIDRQAKGMEMDQEQYGKFMKDYKGEIDSLAESTKFMQSLKSLMDQGVIQGYQYDYAKERFINSQISGNLNDNHGNPLTYATVLEEAGVAPEVVQSFSWSNDNMQLEGKASKMRTLIDEANDAKNGSAAINNLTYKDEDNNVTSIKEKEITDYDSLKFVDGLVKDADREITKNINKLKNTDEYRNAAAARDARNGGSKNSK